MLCCFSSCDTNVQWLDQRGAKRALSYINRISGSLIFTSFLFDPQTLRRLGEAEQLIIGDWLKPWDSSPLLWPLPPGSFVLILFLPLNAALWLQIEAMGRPLACACSVYKVSSTQLYITLLEQWEEPWGCQCWQQFWGHFRLRGHIFRSVILWRPWETPARVTHKIHNMKRTLQ